MLFWQSIWVQGIKVLPALVWNISNFAVWKCVCMCIWVLLNSHIWASAISLANWNKNFLVRSNISSFIFPLHLLYQKMIFLSFSLDVSVAHSFPTVSIWTLQFWISEFDAVTQEWWKAGNVRVLHSLSQLVYISEAQCRYWR